MLGAVLQWFDIHDVQKKQMLLTMRTDEQLDHNLCKVDKHMGKKCIWSLKTGRSETFMQHAFLCTIVRKWRSI